MIRSFLFAIAALALLPNCLPDDGSINGLDVRFQKETPPWDGGLGVCGDNVIEGAELCDGAPSDQSCEDLGYESGTLGCTPDCKSFDVTECTGPGVCGNGFIDDGETCDEGLANVEEDNARCPLYEQSCTLCSTACTEIDGDIRTCGDGVRDVRSYGGNEVCDGEDVSERTCADEGFSNGGTLGCREDCSDYDTTFCQGSQCGDGYVEGDEECEPANDGENPYLCPYGDEDGCTICTWECTEAPGETRYCGDGIIQWEEGEACEIGDIDTWYCDGYGPSTTTCDDDCQWRHEASCPPLESEPDAFSDAAETDTNADAPNADVPADTEPTDATPVAPGNERGCALAMAPATGLVALGLLAFMRRRKHPR